jgi:hypothetical protein
MSYQRRYGIIITLLLIGAGVYYFIVLPIQNPLRQSKEQIRDSVLNVTPLGSAHAEVIILAKARGWDPYTVPGPSSEGDLQADVGYYRDLGAQIRVSITWMFDEAGRLQNILVVKMILDAP